jgi:hypothetical protein
MTNETPRADGTHWADIRQRIAEGVTYGPYRTTKRAFTLSPLGKSQAYGESFSHGELTMRSEGK